ncbi:MAG: beta-lactamase family protein [Anaerolineae bacterium]|nr:beta-lactamase family protein [Anaerolineae bacterium]
MRTSNSLPRSVPEAQGLPSSAILAFVKEVEASIDSLHSFMLLRHGTVVAESWWYPYKPDTPHMLFSLSKSFTSTAVGLAVDEGLLSIDAPVLSFFPGDAPKKVGPNLEAMQVQHLLSMSTGHDQDTTEAAFSRRDRNAVRGFLSLPVEHVPGTHFVYNTAASYMLSAIVQKLTGQTLLDYLTPRLFEPLGIQGATWESWVDGVNLGGWGMSAKTEDIARFGQLYLQRGMWNGRRIVPEAWVEEATTKQVDNSSNSPADWQQGYGYQFWRGRHNTYRGDGAFGQYCIVMSDQDAVLAITSGVNDMQAVLDTAWGKLLPAMGTGKAAVDNTAADELGRALKSLALAPQQGAATSPLAARLSGRTYAFEPNDETLHSLSFDFSSHNAKPAQSCTLTYRLLGGGKRRGTHRLTCGYCTWADGVAAFDAHVPGRVTMPQLRAAASGAWTAVDTFMIKLCQVETPFIATITCRFADDRLFFDLKFNVGFGPTERPQLIGRLV